MNISYTCTRTYAVCEVTRSVMDFERAADIFGVSASTRSLEYDRWSCWFAKVFQETLNMEFLIIQIEWENAKLFITHRVRVLKLLQMLIKYSNV